MNKIEFRAGYYEWLIIINDKLIATTGYPENDERDLTKDDIECFVSNLIDDLKIVANDYEDNEYHYFKDKECACIFGDLKESDIKILRKLMLKAWRYLYD